MKKSILTIGTAILFAIGSTAITGCGQKTEETEQHEDMEGEMHQHEGTESEIGDIEITQCSKWKEGEHKHAAYVCTMWCDNGEKEEAGECGSCGMKLVKFADVKAQHDAQNPEQ